MARTIADDETCASAELQRQFVKPISKLEAIIVEEYASVWQVQTQLRGEHLNESLNKFLGVWIVWMAITYKACIEFCHRVRH